MVRACLCMSARKSGVLTLCPGSKPLTPKLGINDLSFKENTEMRGTKAILAVLVLTAIVGMTSAANAQGVEFLGVGSSAMFTTFGVAAFTDICSSRAGSDCHHWSIKGTTPAGGNWAQAVDGRSPSNPIPNEQGNLWVVWDQSTSPATIWAYLSVDSTVGNRLFFATPRAVLQVDPTANAKAGANLVATSLMFNKQTSATQADEACLPDGTAACVINGKSLPVLSALQTAFTAGMTDIRPEDAKYATKRLLTNYNKANLNGLGYNNGAAANCNNVGYTVNVDLGCPIVSTWSASSKATPVQFNLSKKKDPFTNQAVPPTATISVGAAPIIFVYNASNSAGLGAGGFTDITYTTAASVFDGTKGKISDLPGALGTGTLSVILREPLSGTMNTTEFTTFRTYLAPKYAAPKDSQEKGIAITAACTLGTNCPNPLALPSADGGMRFRAIGTGQVFSGAGSPAQGGILHLPDSIGYAFFSYGNVAPIAGPSGVGRYVTLDGVDPISSAYSTGLLPTCTAPCPVAPNTTFPNLRNGTYRAWSILRLVTDKVGSANYTNAAALVAAAQAEVNNTVPDFVPADR